MHTYMYIHSYIYIYMYRERERERCRSSKSRSGKMGPDLWSLELSGILSRTYLRGGRKGSGAQSRFGSVCFRVRVRFRPILELNGSVLFGSVRCLMSSCQISQIVRTIFWPPRGDTYDILSHTIKQLIYYDNQ